MSIESLYASEEAAHGTPAPGSVWAAKVAAAPNDEGVEVVLPSYDPDLRFGPCAVPAGLHLERYDDVLVIFDETSRPWVASWVTSQ